MRILLVDDDLETARVFAKILTKAGFEVHPACNGQDALQEASKYQPDLVLSDVLMPVMDGYTLCKVWKSNPYLKNIPFIFYSGIYKGLADRAYALSLGAAAFIPKPIDPGALLETIKTVTGGAGADLRKPVPAAPPAPSPAQPAPLPPARPAAPPPAVLPAPLPATPAVQPPAQAPPQAVPQPGAALEPPLKTYNERLVQRMKHEAEEAMQSVDSLRESEARYRQLVEMSPDPIAVHADGEILFINPAGVKLLGAEDARSVVGKPVLEVVHPDYREMVAERTCRMRESGEVAPLAREKFLKLDGTAIDVDVISAPVSYGGQQAFQVIVRDVSEKIKADEALQESGRFLSSVFTSIQDGLSILDRDLTIVMANPAMEKWYADRKPLVGKKCHEVYHDQEEACPDCPVLRAMETRGPVSVVRRATGLSQGQESWMEIFAFPRIEPRTGEVVGAIEYLRDVTERRKAEIALTEAEARYRTLFESASDGIGIHDMRGRMLEANHILCERLGYTREEMLSVLILEIDSPDESARIPERIEALQKSGHIVFETVHRCKDGRLIPTEVSSRLIDYRDQKAVLSICRDISERKSAQEALKESEERLAHARALEKVGMLAQGLAHEVRNPLFTIDVNVAALERQVEMSPAAKPFLGNIHEHVRRLDSLMKDLLELGHPLRDSDFLDCGVHDILLGALNEVSLTIPSGQGRVYLQAPDPSARVRGAPNQLTHVFAHVIANALQNSPPTGKVFIRLQGDPQEVTVTVSDEGFGIPASVMENLFEPFMTTHPGRKGLGLALARHYLHSHGGTISAANNIPPPGATFTIRLPAAN